MKKLDKEIKKIKLTKEDLKQFTPDRIIKDLNTVESQIDKINSLDENITEDDASKLKDNLKQIEIYLMSQYKDYMNLTEKDIKAFEDDVDTKK